MGYAPGGLEMYRWMSDLFPICRSITGDGNRQTLEYLQKLNPDLQLHEAPTGESVFDWKVPREWKIREAFIEHVASGKRFANFAENNLHVWSYSAPVDRVITKDELLEHVRTQPDRPDAIPYVTTYYQENWGFSLSENTRQSLPDGDYRVAIDSELFSGALVYADYLLQGTEQKEVFFSTYFCHPSMANNELSGPVVSTALQLFLRNRFPTPRYSYRFVLVPETIGSLTYLSRHLQDLKENVVAGFQLTCLGDERKYTQIQSRAGATLADKALAASLQECTPVDLFPFAFRDSDERQYCWPGIDLPVTTFCRSKPGTYPEYHTSDDNLELVSPLGLAQSLGVLVRIVESFELGLYPSVATIGEPQLGKRSLYPAIGQKVAEGEPRFPTRVNLDLLVSCDGETSLFDLSSQLDLPLSEVIEEVRRLRKLDLLLP